jgi:hypothetical protein
MTPMRLAIGFLAGLALSSAVWWYASTSAAAQHSAELERAIDLTAALTLTRGAELEVPAGLFGAQVADAVIERLRIREDVLTYLAF